MRPTLYTVDLGGPGTLSTMARPRGGDWLAEEMSGLRDAGVDTLVCALTQAERDELDLTDEEQAAHDAGVKFVSLPIPDRGLPVLEVALPVLRALAGELRQGAHIVTHCRFGIGRASLLAASLLVLDGAEPADAWARLEKARGLPVPDTSDQRQWPGKLTNR